MPAGMVRIHCEKSRTLRFRVPASPPILQYLTFDLSEATDGIATLEAMASTREGQHAAALAEAQQLLDWAWQHHPDSHGPVDEGHAWHHDLQVHVEEGDWHRVALTLTGTPFFMAELQQAFGSLLE